ncbi:MAG: TolB-like 6-bladed beta-propeller domain-containing protein [Bacteroidales bacterium]|nr:TolB-like 6-bladed beta-propeller domain-containing protein [Bacteroidales bacterium]
MDKKIVSLVFQILLLPLCSCNSVNESDFFAFDVDGVNDIAAEPLHLDVRECSADLFTAAINGRFIYSYESSKEWLFTLTDIDTDEVMYKFGCRGRGPDEFIDVFPLQDFFVESGETKTILFSYNDARLLTWNISRSLVAGNDVYENRLHLGDSTEFLPFGSLHLLDKDRLLALDTKQNPRVDEMLAPPVYAIYDLNSCNISRTYELFRNPGVQSKGRYYTSKSFLGMNDCIKPDKAKIAMSMYYFPQINILDLNTGVCKGFRIKGEKKFSSGQQICRFGPLVSDDKYIYALYCGKEVDYSDYDVSADILYIFDWDGDLIRKFRLDVPVHMLRINEADNRLYFYHQARPYLYTIDLDYLSGLMM